MKVTPIIADNWKFDGGVAFGVVPKSIWSRIYPSDHENLIKMTTRCLLVETDNRLVLIDAGMGNKRDEKYYRYKYRFGDDSLERSIKRAGYSLEDVSDVILTHLHDDHAGGVVYVDENQNHKLTFPNAKHYCSKRQYDNLMRPNAREKATLFRDNIEPVNKFEKLYFLEEEGQLTHEIGWITCDGHTPGQVIPMVKYNGNTIVFTADLIPSAAHVPLPYIASVDLQPLEVLKEKEALLMRAVENGWILFFEHDFYHECGKVRKTEKGVRVSETFRLDELDG